MSSSAPPPAGPGPTPALLAPRRLIMLPFSDLLINQITDQKWPITPGWQPVLALGYGLGPNEPRVFRTDDAGSLVVTTAGATALSKVVITDPAAAGDVITSTFDGLVNQRGLLVRSQVRAYDGAGSEVTLAAATGTILAQQTSNRGLLVALPGQIPAFSAPALGAQASASRAAGAAGVRHICTGYEIIVSCQAAPGAGQLLVNLRDGASGAGTILKTYAFEIPAAIFAPMILSVSGKSIVGSVATAMTLESSAAYAAVGVSVAFDSYDAI